MKEIELKDNDYVLSEHGAWFTFGDLSIRIRGMGRAKSPQWPMPALKITVYERGDETSDALATLEVEQPTARRRMSKEK